MRCLDASGLLAVFKEFLETGMTKASLSMLEIAFLKLSTFVLHFVID